MLQMLGNSRVNSIYEGSYDAASSTTPMVAAKPKVDSDRKLREQWCRAKYVDRAFVTKTANETGVALNRRLFNAVDAGDPSALLHALACGANPNWHNDEQEQRCALHYAITYNDLVLSEVLLQHGALLTEVDERKWTPLHTAAFQADAKMMELLLARGGATVKDSKDAWNKNALEIAREHSEFASTVVPLLEKANEAAEKRQKAKAAAS